MSSSDDALWLDYSNYNSPSTVSRGYTYTTTSPGGFTIRDAYTYEPIKWNVDWVEPAKPKRNTESDKEKTEDMASNHTFSAEDREEIDETVREAIVGPKRVAEVATRKAAVEALGIEDNREIGAVLTFKRKIGKIEHLHVALKVDEDKWHVAGADKFGTKTWEDLLTWMTTGEYIVSDVKVATAFEDITWETVPVIPTQTPVMV